MFGRVPRSFVTSRCRPAGFSLIELLVVLLIIGVLLAILLPVLSRSKALARQLACANNLRQVGIGVWGYAVDAHGALPPRYRDRGGPSFDTVRMRLPSGEAVNIGVLQQYVDAAEVFYCPTQTDATSPSLGFDTPANEWVPPQAGSPPGRPPQAGPPDGVNSSFPARAIDPTTPRPPAWTTANYHNKVIYSDFLGVDGFKARTGAHQGPLRAPHGGRGYNRLFGDGSVSWIAKGPLEDLRPIGSTLPDERELHEYYRLLDVAP